MIAARVRWNSDDGPRCLDDKLDAKWSEAFINVIPSWCTIGFHPRVRQILIEFHDRLLIQGQYKRKVVYSCLDELGYALVYENMPSKEEVVFIHVDDRLR